jgi:hypothetical protein
MNHSEPAKTKTQINSDYQCKMSIYKSRCMYNSPGSLEKFAFGVQAPLCTLVWTLRTYLCVFNLKTKPGSSYYNPPCNLTPATFKPENRSQKVIKGKATNIISALLNQKPSGWTNSLIKSGLLFGSDSPFQCRMLISF